MQVCGLGGGLGVVCLRCWLVSDDGSILEGGESREGV